MNRGARDLRIPQIQTKPRRLKEEETYQLANQFPADADELAKEQADILTYLPRARQQRHG